MEFRKRYVFLICLRFLKISPKTFGPQSVKQLFVDFFSISNCQYNPFSKKNPVIRISAYPVDSSSQLIRISGVELYFINPNCVVVVLNKCLEPDGLLYLKNIAVFLTPKVHLRYT